MAPIRRYLRITRYSVLEVRIYLEKPSDSAWLLSSRDPVLTRVVEKIRPKVLPKLREEYENSKKKGTKKKKGIKDTIVQDDFEVVMFLTDSTTRHSLITKRKQFSKKPDIKSTSTKLTGWLANDPDNVAIDLDIEGPASLLREESDEDIRLNDVPEADENSIPRQDECTMISSEEETEPPANARVARSRNKSNVSHDVTGKEDKKKLALNTSYEGFSLYGKILCLIVKRKESKKTNISAAGAANRAGPEMMENWISTQVNQQADLDDINET